MIHERSELLKQQLAHRDAIIQSGWRHIVNLEKVLYRFAIQGRVPFRDGELEALIDEARELLELPPLKRRAGK